MASLFVSVGAHAAFVTVDFEEFSIGDGAGPYPTVLTSQGYEFTGQGDTLATSAEVIAGNNVGGTNAYGGFVAGLGQDGFNYAVTITIEKADGGAFAIHDFDLFMDTDPGGWQEIRGTLAGGGITFLSSPGVGTGDWLNLESVTFRAEGNGFDFGFGTIEIDNVIISAVPVPAAVWLFGSALFGLAWFRQR